VIVPVVNIIGAVVDGDLVATGSAAFDRLDGPSDKVILAAANPDQSSLLSSFTPT